MMQADGQGISTDRAASEATVAHSPSPISHSFEPNGGRVLRRSFLVGLALLPAACDRASTKADILKKAEGAKTKADLEKQLGKPSEVDKVGPMEQWTYKASDGSVVFMLVNDRIVFDATGGKSR